jgi:putative ABC transport system permease protein
MFKNYVITALRNLLRHKGFTALNVAGLTLGLTACLLISLFVWDELHYDAFVPQGENVYRIYNEMPQNHGTDYVPRTSPVFASTLRQEFPEVETAAGIQEELSKQLVEDEHKKIYVEGGWFAEDTFFEVFDLPFKWGSPQQALTEPTSIILGEDLAERFFGSQNPVGKEIRIRETTFQVKGVLQNKDLRFHIKIDYILPLAAANLPEDLQKSWTWLVFNTYVKLKSGADISALQTKFQQVATERIAPELPDGDFGFLPFFQPLHAIYLHSSSFKMDCVQRGNNTYVRALGLIAVFILLIACFNFVNLATAKSLKRAQEVGVRKSMGASRSQLMIQFLSETVLLTSISVVFAAALTSFFLPALNSFTGKQMQFNLFAQPFLFIALPSLALLIGLLAGYYPAIVLSGFKPVKVLRGAAISTAGNSNTGWLRSGLVVMQFTLSIFLVISAIVVFKQVSYLQGKDLGFDKEQIMFFPLRGAEMINNSDAFKEELTRLPGVTSATMGYGFPGDLVAGDEIIVPKEGQTKTHPVIQLMVDYDYITTLGIELVAGRDFSKDFTTDKDHAFIINETAVRALGLGRPDMALGQALHWKMWGKEGGESLKIGQVVGVVKDFHYRSLFDVLEPAVLQINPRADWKVAVKLSTNDVKGTIEQVGTVWHTFSPGYPFEFTFLDENFERMYTSEVKLRQLLWIFTAIAIFIACLGIFGLAAYTAERRKKEIGIRKILGADIPGLVLMLSGDFLKLVGIAALLASPLAWYAMHMWLQDFAYRIDIPLWTFGVAGAIGIVLAFITAGYQAYRAATVNPVKNLRTE